jgi:tetratricopeptide (TPR) repeat protein
LPQDAVEALKSATLPSKSSSPSHTRTLTHLPTTVEEWKDQGNQLFKEKRYAEALSSYDQALSLRIDPNLVMSLLNNIGACFMTKKQDSIAGIYYIASAYIFYLRGEPDDCKNLVFKAYAKAAVIIKNQSNKYCDYILAKLIKLDRTRYYAEKDLTVVNEHPVKGGGNDHHHRTIFMSEVATFFTAFIKNIDNLRKAIDSLPVMTDKTPLDLKNLGDQSFMMKDINAASENYFSALIVIDPIVSTLLLNRAAVMLAQENYNDTALSSILSMALSSNLSINALYRLLKALSSASIIKESLAIATLATERFPDEASLKNQLSELSSLEAATSASMITERERLKM